MSSPAPKTALITGAARGIGYGIAECLAAKGIQIVIADLREELAREAAAKLAQQHGVRTLAVACDITVRDQVAAALARAEQEYGGLDILVNNAGICPFVHIMEMSEEMFRKTIDVDLIGAFHCTQLAARQMIRLGRRGRIVNITSLAVNVTGAGQVDYAAAKAGLHMLTKGFAIALGPHGITVNAVAPGMILTDMTRHYWEQPGPAEMIKKRVPAGRIGQPTDIGKTVAFLVSDEAEYVNGISIIVDGGHQAVCN